MTDKIESFVIPCTECSAGQMHRRFLTYFTYLGEELITVPDFPAWVCDICGRREYDMNALNQLNLLLTPNAGRGTRKVRRPQRSSVQKKGQRPTRAE